MDNLTKAQRRKNMQHIHSKNTSIEKIMFSLLKKEGIKFRRHYSDVIGKPDIAVPNKKVVVFLDSDFWHGWNFSRWKKRLPKKYWQDKITHNIKRDRNNFAKLRRIGWSVVRLWGHQIENNPSRCVDLIIKTLKDKTKCLKKN